jgi:uncharacterized protein (TIGR03435 family)
MVRSVKAASVFAIGFLNVPAGRAQAPSVETPSLKFEVASIKPSQSAGGTMGIRPAPGGERYIATNITLKLLITVAYRIRADQVAGGPAWMDTAAFDMNAKAERPSSLEELHAMLQNLLADRFKLRFHRETKEMPIYALTVDKDGPKLKAHQASSAGDPFIHQTMDHFPQMTWSVGRCRVWL